MASINLSWGEAAIIIGVAFLIFWFVDRVQQ